MNQQGKFIMAIEKFKGRFTNEANGCTTLVNETIQNISDLMVLGLYTYLCTKPDTWEPNYKEIMSHFKLTKTTTYKYLNKMLDLGLMSKVEVREKGRFAYVHYFVHLRFMTPFPKKWEAVKAPLNIELSPFPKKWDPVPPETVIPETYITKRSTKQRSKKTNTFINTKIKKESAKKPKNAIIVSPQITENEMKPTNYKETYYPVPTVANEVSKELAITGPYNLTTEQADTFERFWSLYPSKKNKRRAQALWFAGGHHLNAETIIEKLKLQIKDDKHFLEGYNPSVCNYITENRWEDEIEIKKVKSHFDHTDRSWALKKDIFD